MNLKFWRKKKPEINWVAVTCSSCKKKYWSSPDGNPDGVSICDHCGQLDFTFEVYCPSPDGTRYTPEEWDRLYGDKK